MYYCTRGLFLKIMYWRKDYMTNTIALGEYKGGKRSLSPTSEEPGPKRLRLRSLSGMLFT